MIIADAAIKFIIDPMGLDTYIIIPHNESLVPNNDMCQQINVKERLWIASLCKIIVTQNAFQSTNNLRERLHQKQKFELKN